eukprot:CAMPEP_0172410030 /NCGR_PEP_ID=MMETSP1061-20121228/76671_1 /TAXON_ID=37318 /ORGANISM="Pseudo-nitzschia pungens, Strain cf. pungens" /LENGTH=433 /DNA_ID=CAMNT_0013146199 /DNA_START=830 /DNA_END=2131 /DNA_ORIENTATION=+
MHGYSIFGLISSLSIYSACVIFSLNVLHLRVIYDPPSSGTQRDAAVRVVVVGSSNLATSSANVDSDLANGKNKDKNNDDDDDDDDTKNNNKNNNKNKNINININNHDDPGKDPENDDGIDWTDSIFTFDKHSWDNDPIVIESHKLLFFTIPKNACSTYKQLFRRMMGHSDWNHPSVNPHDPSTNGLKYLGQYPPQKQRKFLTSPDWTRAIVVRDPLERVLSAYMDKALHTGPAEWKPRVEGAHVKKHCCNSNSNSNNNNNNAKTNPACQRHPLVPYTTPLTEDNFPFSDFVEYFLTTCKDAHWKPQHLRLHKGNLKWINFVGHFETIKDDTKRLLERIGAYEEFGATGWGKRHHHNNNNNNNNTLAIFEKNLANHKTGSGTKVREHYANASRTERLVLQYYRLDYSSDVFNLTRPDHYTQKLFGRHQQQQQQQ